MIKDNKYIFILLVAIFAVVTYFHAVIKEVIFSPFSDFGNYWLNASIIKQGLSPWSDTPETEAAREKLVKENNFYIPWPSFNSLGFMAFMQLFTLFNFRLAAFLWAILGHILLLLSLGFMLWAARGKKFSEDFFCVLFLVFSFWPMREALHDGQVCFMTLFFMAISTYFMKGKKWFFAGILLGLAILTKEYLAVSLLAFIWKRQWKILSGVVWGVLLVKMYGIFVFGWPMELSYLKYIFGIGTQIYTSVNNHNLMSGILRVGKDLIGSQACVVLGLALIAILITLAMYWTRKTNNVLLSFFPFLALSFIFTPWIHESHYIILLPAIIATWFYIGQEKELLNYVLYILSYLLLGLGYSLNRFPLFHSGLPALFTTGKLIGMIIFFILVGRLANDPALKEQ